MPCAISISRARESGQIETAIQLHKTEFTVAYARGGEGLHQLSLGHQIEHHHRQGGQQGRGHQRPPFAALFAGGREQFKARSTGSCAPAHRG